MNDETIMTVYFVMRGGGFVYGAMPLKLIQEITAQKRDGWWISSDKCFAVDLSEVVGMYCVPYVGKTPMERIADATEKAHKSGEGWKGDD